MHGFTVAIGWGVGILLLAALVVAVLINGKERRAGARPRRRPGRTETLAEEPARVRSASTPPWARTRDRDRTAGAPRTPRPLSAGGSRLRRARVVSGRIRGAGGTPLPGATITLVELGGRQLGRVTTKDDGSYTLNVAVAGSYVLIVAADGHQPQAATITVGDEPLIYELTLSGTSGLDRCRPQRRDRRAGRRARGSW